MLGVFSVVDQGSNDSVVNVMIATKRGEGIYWLFSIEIDICPVIGFQLLTPGLCLSPTNQSVSSFFWSLVAVLSFLTKLSQQPASFCQLSGLWSKFDHSKDLYSVQLNHQLHITNFCMCKLNTFLITLTLSRYKKSQSNQQGKTTQGLLSSFSL